ncbi:MAG: hypothetical protein WED07_16505 [Candidatus Freyarchaeum deiterrae]
MSGIQASRNTVSKYVASLEAKKKVISKRIGAYNLYLSAERKYLPRERMVNFSKEILSGLKRYFPNQEQNFKKIGSEFGKYFNFRFPEVIDSSLTNRNFLELFGDTFNIQDPFQLQTEIKIVELNEKGNKALYRFKKSSFLEDLDDCSYLFYVLCGVVETVISRYFKRTAKCDVVTLKISDKKDESFADISIEIIE